MTVAEALAILDAVLKPSSLNDLQELVFRKSWEGQTYLEIAESSGYDPSYIKDVGFRLWQLLSETFDEKVTKSNVRSLLRRRCADVQVPTSEEGVSPPTPLDLKNTIDQRQDWGEAVDVSVFYDRTEELGQLKQWIVDDRCRLVAILGMGGIGKTALSVKLAEQIQGEFEYVIWRSLRNAPPLEQILADFIQFLSNQKEIDLPTKLGARVSRLINYLRSSRCLLILDNTEIILRSGEGCHGNRLTSAAGHYREGYEGYGEFLNRVGELRHQSCLVMTSREKPREFVSLEGESLPVRSLQLTGLNPLEGRKIFHLKGSFAGSEAEWQAVIAHYAGNPLALKIVAAAVQELFDGKLADFLAILQQGVFVFDDIRDILDRQFERLSELEQEIMYWLAIEREAVTISELQSNLLSPLSRQKAIGTIKALFQRSLIEKQAAAFSQQPVVMEYMTDRLVNQFCESIVTGDLAFFNNYFLIKAQAKEYVREIQTNLILKPIINELITILGSPKSVENQLARILSQLREQLPKTSGYGGGNILNLLCQLQTDCSNWDFSNLSIWQAYLQGMTLHGINLTGANLAGSIFTETLGSILSVAFSPQGKCLAAGDADGQIRVWQVRDDRSGGTLPLLTCKGHTNWVRSVVFSPDGRILASGSYDQTVKIWEVNTGELLRTLHGHGAGVKSVTFSPDGRILASSSDDHTVRLWDVERGECLQVLQGHTNWVWSVTFHPQGGQLLASSSEDKTVRVWQVSTGQCLKVLYGHGSRVWSVAFSPESQILASGSYDQTVKLWEFSTGQCLKTLQGYSNGVRCIAFNPDGQTLASGSDDQTVRLWNINEGKCTAALRGHTSRVWAVDFDLQGQILASSGEDKTVRLWDVTTGQCLRTLQGHGGWVWSVAFSPQDQILATSSEDKTVRLWDVETGDCLKILRGHAGWVWSVAFSPDGQILASGSYDQTVRLWKVRTGQCFRILHGHTNRVWAIAFSPQGQILASGGEDHVIKLWNLSTGECFKTLEGHTNWIRSVAFSPDGNTLASAGDDQTVKLWDVGTGDCLKTLQGHTSWIESVAFSRNNRVLASGGQDDAIALWDTETGQYFKTLRADRPYEGMNINHITGLTEATIETLKALGAVAG